MEYALLKDFLFIKWSGIEFAGSLVLIHGQVYHKSERNTSAAPRHAYTFHMVETDGCQYSHKNWLQATKELPFPKLFGNWKSSQTQQRWKQFFAKYS